MKQISHYQEMLSVVKEVDKELKATAFRQDSFVQVALDDGSFFLWKQAFMQNPNGNEDWIAVYTEHYGYFLFHSDDVMVKDTNDHR